MEKFQADLYLDRLDSSSLRGQEYWQNEYKQTYIKAQNALDRCLATKLLNQDEEENIRRNFADFESVLRDELHFKSQLTDLDLEAMCVNLLKLPEEVFLDSYGGFLDEVCSQSNFDILSLKRIIQNNEILMQDIDLLKLNHLLIEKLVENKHIGLLLQLGDLGIADDLLRFDDYFFLFYRSPALRLLDKQYAGYSKLIKFLLMSQADSTQELETNTFVYNLGQDNNGKLFLEYLKSRLDVSVEVSNVNPEFVKYYNKYFRNNHDLLGELLEFDDSGSRVISRIAEVLVLAEGSMRREELEKLYSIVDSSKFITLISSLSFSINNELLTQEDLVLDIKGARNDLKFTTKCIEYILWYGWKHNLLGYRLLSFVDTRVPELSNQAFLRKQNLYSPTFTAQEGMSLDGVLPEHLRPQSGMAEVYIPEFSLKDGSQISGWDLLLSERPFEELPKQLQSEVQAYMMKYGGSESNARDEVRVKYHEHILEGDGKEFTNIYAFHRAGLTMAQSETLAGKEHLTLTYPGIGSHMSSLELITTIINQTPSLGSVDFNVTEWEDTRGDILSMLKFVAERNSAITDLDDEWVDFNVDYDLAHEDSFVSSLSFKLLGRDVSLRFFYRAFEGNVDNHWSGRQNIIDSDVIIIHDLEAGMGDKQNDEALRSVVHNVKQVGTSKLIVVNFAAFFTEKQRGLFKDVNMKVLEVNPCEQYGCSCVGTAMDGMVVLEVSSLTDI